MKLHLKPNHFKAIDILCFEAAFAMAFEAWMGSTYLSGLAGELHVDLLFVTVLTSLPWIGSAGQLLSIRLLARATSLRRYTITLAWMGRTLWFIPILAAAIWGTQAYVNRTPFPANAWFLVVSCIALVAALIGTSSGIAWNSWMRGIIPTHFQARFFGLRQRYVMFTLIFANLFASLLINWKVRGLHVGYFIIITLAALSAMMSTIMLSRAPDAPRAPVDNEDQTLSLLAPLRDESFRKVLTFGAVFNGTVFFCAPYFSYFYTKELHFPLGTVAFWTGFANLGSFLAATFWAKRVDKSPGVFATLVICGHLVALAPAVYILPSAAAVQYIAPFEFFINGIAWCGYGIASSTLLFRTCPPGKNWAYFSIYSATAGLAGAIGVIAGGQVAQLLAPFGGFRAMWFVGTMMRLTVLWTLLPPLKSQKALQRRRVTEGAIIHTGEARLSRHGTPSLVPTPSEASELATNVATPAADNSGSRAG